MSTLLRRRIFLPLLLILFGLVLAKFLLPHLLSAQTAASAESSTSSGSLGGDIDAFFAAGAKAFILWQYSGNKESPLKDQSDQYSVYKGDPFCDVLAEKAAQYPDKLLGVNMHNLAAAENVGQAEDQLSYLNQKCGVKIIRIFADKSRNLNLDNVAAVMTAAERNNIQVIVAGEDYANVIGPKYNGNPTVWYSSDYVSDGYFVYIQTLASKIKGFGNLFAIELSNEPHCNGAPSCPDPYFAWAATVSQAIGGKVGIGQMANNEGGRGDSPGNGDFAKSNSPGSITTTSAHYYKPEERAEALIAAAEAQKLGKEFYIGEAPATLRADASHESSKPLSSVKPAEETTGPYFEYNIQRDSTYNIVKNFVDEYSVSCLPKADFKLAFENQYKCMEADFENGTGDPKRKVICPGDWRKWLESNKRYIPGELQINFNGGQLFGLFRNEAKVNQQLTGAGPTDDRFDSLEKYLATRTAAGDPLGNKSNSDTQPAALTQAMASLGKNSVEFSVRQAPMYKLLTLEQQCSLVMDKLRAVKELCKPENRIKGEENKPCAIDLPIYNTKYKSHQELLSVVGDRSCKDLMEDGDANQEQLRHDILTVNPAMETAYRPAFVVAVTKFEARDKKKGQNVTVDHPDTAPDANQQSSDFYFLDYLEVKVPAFGSDFIRPDSEEISNPDKNNKARNSYKDPLFVTANSITTLKQQEAAIKEEETDRKYFRNTLGEQSGLRPYGLIIGNNGEPTVCYIGGKLQECKPIVSGKGGVSDSIPAALRTFINAWGDGYDQQGHKMPKTNYQVPCQGSEKDFYSPENKQMIAEQARQIGSMLKTKSVGIYDKKTEIKGVKKTDGSLYTGDDYTYKVEIKDLPQAGPQINTYTELYFVAPHNYKLEYFYSQMYNFLTLDQRARMEDGRNVAAPDATALKKDALSEFPLSMRTYPTEKVGGSRWLPGTVEKRLEPCPDEKNPNRECWNDYPFTVKTSFTKILESAMHPLMWRVAGQVASLPTRFMALVTTTVDSELNQYTRGCAKSTGSANLFPTEDWFLGRCKGGPATTTTPGASGTPSTSGNVCEASNNQYSKQIDGRNTVLTESMIALALEVSKYTCTPAEVIIGVMLQETAGKTVTDFSKPIVYGDNSVPIQGDPNGTAMGNRSVCANPGQNTTCGAFSFSNTSINNFYSAYNQNLADACLKNATVNISGKVSKLNFSGGTLNPQSVGQSACVAGSYLWEYVGRGLPGCEPGKGSYTLNDINQAQLRTGLSVYNGDPDPAKRAANVEAYINKMKAYSAEIEAFRNKCAYNTGSTGAN